MSIADVKARADAEMGVALLEMIREAGFEVYANGHNDIGVRASQAGRRPHTPVVVRNPPESVMNVLRDTHARRLVAGALLKEQSHANP